MFPRAPILSVFVTSTIRLRRFRASRNTDGGPRTAPRCKPLVNRLFVPPRIRKSRRRDDSCHHPFAAISPRSKSNDLSDARCGALPLSPFLSPSSLFFSSSRDSIWSISWDSPRKAWRISRLSRGDVKRSLAKGANAFSSTTSAPSSPSQSQSPSLSPMRSTVRVREKFEWREKRVCADNTATRLRRRFTGRVAAVA